MQGLSKKEIEMVSWLELEGKRFFEHKDIERFFKNKNEKNVYIHNLRNKKRIVKINKTKYYLIPIQAYENQWSEHPFIIIDETCNGKNYYIGGKAAAHYWKITNQIPKAFNVYTSTRQGTKKILTTTIHFKRQRKLDPKKYTKKTINGHAFNIATKEESKQWK